ncbi:MAG: phage tail protein [Firmicutes bacterium]|nr:phage tail protein [Bacillota bacterium]
MILNLLNQNKTPIGELDQLDNCYITELLETGEDTLSFEIYVKHLLYKDLIEENLILTDDNRYVIKSIDERGQTTIFGCSLDLSDFMVAGYHLFFVEEITLSAYLNQVLAGTGWSFTGDESITSAKTVSLESGNTLDLLRLAEKTYGVIFRYDCIGKIIRVTTTQGYTNKGVHFSDELNIKECELRGDSFDLVTRLYAFGKDGLSFEDINGGKAYVENFQYTSKVITQVWVDERYELKEELLAAAQKKVAGLSIPNRVYTASVVDLSSLLPDDYRNLAIAIGDKVTLIDRIRGIEVEHQIVKLVSYPDTPEKNVAELGRVATDFESTITKLKTEDIKEAIDKTVPPAVNEYMNEYFGGQKWLCVEAYPEVMDANTLYLKYVSG